MSKDFDVILAAFVQSTNDNGYPQSVFSFCSSMELSESEFYKTIGSFRALEQRFWVMQWTKCMETLEADATFQGYNANEKALALFFTWTEQLAMYKSFILACLQKHKRFSLYKRTLSCLESDFKTFAEDITRQGIEEGLVRNRPFITPYYSKALWFQFLLILDFWIHDESQSHEATDEAIEKAVNLAFQLLAETPVDSIVDLARFLIKSYNK
jgi:hypothetical protein